MADEVVAKTGSKEWLVVVLKKSESRLGERLWTSEVVKDEVTEIGTGKGLASRVYNHVLHFNNGRTHSIVVKIPRGPEDQLGAEKGDQEVESSKESCFDRFQNSECKFFTDFPRLHTVLPTPNVYLAIPYGDPDRDPVIVMDSLVGRAAVGCISDYYNSHQVFNMAKDTAKFQAHFMTLGSQSWVQNYPMDIIDDKYDLEFFKSYFVDAIGNFGDGSLKPLVTSLAPIIFNPKVWMYTLHTSYKSLGLPVVMCHNDTWVNNILLKLNEDGSLGNQVAAYIDWQFVHAGCLAIDLACILAFCVRPSFQRQFQYQVFECYYDTLKKEVEDKNGRVDFSLDQVILCYKANFIGIVARDLAMQILSLEQLSVDVDEWTREARNEEMFTKLKLMLKQTAEFVKVLPKELME
ncbi:hypothetical protein L596_022596 [Steinernema carpocapsae]|uniref:CHK kinase-like domain-containing protein n=1 Tax=Steinernema carpocapsae TaxID=34508 RepID=A0A4U5MM99_STECR|nr:hypothetical protein L596_022596 [Steinernema carpocapsae]